MMMPTSGCELLMAQGRAGSMAMILWMKGGLAKGIIHFDQAVRDTGQANFWLSKRPQRGIPGRKINLSTIKICANRTATKTDTGP